MSEIVLPAQVAQESTSIVQRASALTIASNPDLELAGELLRGIKTVRGRISDTFDAHIEAAHKAHKSLLATKKNFEGPMVDAEMVIKRKMGVYQQEQERIRREEESRLREVARKEEENRRMQEAEALERQGEQQAAAAVIEAPMPIVVVPKSVPKIDGVSTRIAFKYRIINEAIIPRQYMMPNEKAIGAVVRSLGKAANIPGVEVYEESIVTAKGF